MSCCLSRPQAAPGYTIHCNKRSVIETVQSNITGINCVMSCRMYNTVGRHNTVEHTEHTEDSVHNRKQCVASTSGVECKVTISSSQFVMYAIEKTLREINKKYKNLMPFTNAQFISK